MFSFQELRRDPCDMGPCIIMLKHEVMAVAEWPQDHLTVSLSIEIALDKMQLCSLSVVYACPYHNPTATMGHSSHNVEICKALAHMTPYTWSVVVRPVGRTANFSKTMLQSAYGNSQPANCMFPKTWDICGIVLCDKTAHFRVAFYCPQHKVHMCNDPAV